MAQLNIVLNQAPGGTLNAILGSPGPQGPQGPQGPKGDPGEPGVIPAWGSITGTLSNQTDLQSALNGKYSTSNPDGYISSWTGGTITSNIQSSNSSQFITWDGGHHHTDISPTIIQITNSDQGGGALSIESDGITFLPGQLKQVEAYPGTIILNGYAQESWVTAQLIPYATQTWVGNNYYPLTANPSGFLTKGADGAVPSGGAINQVLAKASNSDYVLNWVDQSIFNGGAITNSITIAGATYDTELSSDFFGVQLSSDHTKGSTVEYNGLHTYDGVNSLNVNPTGITFPDSTVQVTAYTGGGGTWGSITGTLSNQTDLQSALDLKYSTSNPNGFIDQSTANYLYYGINNPDGFINQSTADGLYYGIGNPSGFITSGDLAPFARIDGVAFTGDVRFNTDSGVDQGMRLLINGTCDPSGTGFSSARLNFSDTEPNQPTTGDVWFNWNYGIRYCGGSGGGTHTVASEDWSTNNFYPRYSNPSGFATLSSPTFTGDPKAPTPATSDNDTSIATTAFVKAQGYLTSAPVTSVAGRTGAITLATTDVSGMSAYAQLSGSTFTGKVNFATIAGSQSPSLNLGGTVDPNATNAVSGDFWISNAASPKVSYKVGSGTYYCTTNNLTNTFSAPQVFDTTSNTLAAVRITQKGTFPALVVEDALNPDATAFVVDQNGAVGVGVDPSTFSPTNKVEIVGSVKATSITFDGTAQFKVNSVTTHGSGPNTHDLYVSFNGSTYRIPMIFVSTP
ncbi:hypothetical protein UFOVP201_36 [uncultured Caudovirales phage]|uniref:Collagen triple helix repeat n=1 Tax=uncultured Caudovirales phage TaxID=2100421 RepID=A0A6J7WIY6_9CAUD|nr:hypothetical protein UFOVP201_36 [uncultured Caudovirales phage]